MSRAAAGGRRAGAGLVGHGQAGAVVGRGRGRAAQARGRGAVGGPGGGSAAGQRGAALVLSLLLLALLCVLVSQLAFSAKVDHDLAANARDDLKLELAGRSALALVRAHLRADWASPQGKQVDSLREPWAEQAVAAPMLVGDVRVTVRIEDAERRLNVNLLALEQSRQFAARVLADLCAYLRLPQADEVAERIADWIDTDEQGRFERGARNGPLFHPSELLEIPELPAEALLGGVDAEGNPYPGLLEFVTTWGSGLLNLNTMPAELLWAVLPPQDANGRPIDRDAALQAILEFRTGAAPDQPAPPSSPGAPPPGQDFENVDALKRIPGLADVFPPPATGGAAGGAGTGGAQQPARPRGLREQLTVRSQDFLVRIEASHAEQLRRYEALLRRDEQGFRVLLWRELVR
ncbi:MAG: hypothetical protein KatS3mg102_1074 [Planctomycetota bacterium]|nr:MAG: hypothetical protein KatS3mg102_1074 [Planctomycetota bacterium]